MKLNRNKKILLTLGGILIVFGLYKYFNVVEGLTTVSIADYNAQMAEINTQFMPTFIKYDTPEIINSMKEPKNVNTSITNLKTAIQNVKSVYDKIIAAGNYSRDKKKAKKQRDGIKDAKTNANNSYNTALKSYEQTITDGNPLWIKNGQRMSNSEVVTYYTKETLDSLKLALDALNE
jgi:hypothetical protein